MTEHSEFNERLKKFLKKIKSQKKCPPPLPIMEARTKQLDNINPFLAGLNESSKNLTNPSNLKILYSLLNPKNESATKFWRAVGYFLITRNPSEQNIRSQFTYSHIIGLLKLVHQNHISKQDDESEELLDAVKDFVSSSAFLTSTTVDPLGSYIANQYSWMNAHDQIIYGITSHDEELLDKVTIEYKLLLLNVLLEINGIVTYEKASDSGIPIQEDIEMLEDMGLILSSKTLRTELPDDHGLRYTLNDAPESIEEYEKDPILEEIKEPYAWFGDLDIDPMMRQEHLWHFRSLKNRYNSFIRLIPAEVLLINDRYTPSPEPEQLGSNTITFDDILHLFKVGELDMEDYAQAFGYLSSLLVAHERLLNHMNLTKAELALLAGLKSERTISNEISKGTLKKTEAGGYVSYESAIEWLHDKDIKRRRREWKDLIGSPLHLEEILEKL